MRRRLCFVFALLLAPTTANAHDHIAAAFFAFCFADASSLPGAQFTWEQAIPANPKVTILGDVNFHGGEHEDVDIKRFGYFIGARYTFAEKKSRFVPSVHFLTGSVIDNAGPQQGGSPAIAVGGAYDIMSKREASGWGVRLQAELVVNSGQNYGKYSAGLVYRIHSPTPTP
jgi:hypothetical protein